MSILTRPIGKSKSKSDPTSNTDVARVSEAPAAVSARSKAAPPVLSAAPRADLLPPEIGQRHAAQRARRWMRAAIVLVLVLTVAGIGGAWAWSMLAQSSLVSAQAESAQLTSELHKYDAVKQLKGDIEYGTAAQQVGGSTDIDWQKYLQDLQGALPSDVVITALSADTAGIDAPFAQIDGSGAASSVVGTISFTAQTATLPSVPDWVDALEKVPGYVDATPGSIQYDPSEGYKVQVVMHIDKGAYSGRFAVKGDDK